MLLGRCACKAVGYEVADEFVVAYNCHCSNCRAMTGSAFLPWGEIEPEKLSVKKGTDSLLVDGDADVAHAVCCGQCWSLLIWTVDHHDRTWLRVPYGSLTDEPTLKPIAHMFVGSKAPWYAILDDLFSTTSTRGRDRGSASVRRYSGALAQARSLGSGPGCE